MAFPTVASITASSRNTNATTHTVTLPGTIVAGEKLVALFACDNQARALTTITWPAGWDERAERILPAGTETGFAVADRIADGTEGTSITVTTDTSETFAAQVYRVSSWHGTAAAEAASPSNGESTTPDPPNLTPSYGAEDTLWIAVGTLDIGGTTISAAPTNYTDLTTTQSGTGFGDVEVYSARRELNATSEDPGGFTASTTAAWHATTVAIRPAAGGGTFTLTAEPGSVAVTGTAATLAYNRHVIAQAGSVAITGTAATLAHNRRLSAEAAAVAITGTDATLTHNTTTTFTLTAESGAFTITGTAATLAYNRHLIAEPGSVAITGSPITLRLIINGTPGSFVITPTDATLTYRRKITAEAGTVAVTGTAATLRHNRVLPADSGSFAITGTDATLTYSAANRITIVADPGAFVITPTDATLRTTRRIAAASGSIVWTGQDATLLLASRRLVAESASFAITGTAATLTYSAAVVADPSVTIQTTARTRTVETT